MEQIRNWAGNLAYGAAEVLVPESLDEVREMVAGRPRIKALGTRHSFNDIADSEGSLLSVRKLNRVVALDRERRTVTVEGGIRYGELAAYLHDHGFALPNLASLPHISVAGACATATHGSGDRNGNLATAVRAAEIVKADGETVVFSRDGTDEDIAGAAVGLGALGVVTKLTLDVVPTFQVSQDVYENLPLERLKDGVLEQIFASAYSVSLFTDWRSGIFHQIWLKRKLTGDVPAAAAAEPDLFGATKATEPRHPMPGGPAENCSEQLGVPGPWSERLAHFRLAFTPSAGDELQSEYYVARQDAYAALCEIDRLRDRIAPLLHVSEIRSIAADDLWMSPCYRRHSVSIHLTWKPEEERVRQVLPLIEERLAPFRARPHWAKLFAMEPARLRPLFERLPDFRRLALRCDPEGKFRNRFLNRYLFDN